MRFNPNCVRDILLVCEKHIGECQELYVDEYDIDSSLSKYSWNELLYHLNQCKMSGLFDEHSGEDVVGGFFINDLSPNGHAFLQNIQSNAIWKKLLKKSVTSLPGLISAAIEIAGLI